MTLRARFLLPAACAALLVAGCHSTKKETKPDLGSPDDYQTIVKQGTVSETFSEPTEYQQNMGLRAQANGSTIILSARNRSQEQITISAQDLALITGPDPQKDLVLINPSTADLHQFTPLILNPGQPGVVSLPIRVPAQLRGSRLVYNNPRQGILFYVVIE